MSLYPLLRPLLFALPPEFAHGLSLAYLRMVGAVPPLTALQRRWTPRVEDPVTLFGLRFPNRVGLAAGYDKDAQACRGLEALGFGHLELGTVTPRPQPGNPRPRIFRLPAERSLINRLGFPSQGAAKVFRRLQRRPWDDVIVGVNLGKQKETRLEAALEDYLSLVEIFAPLADYLAINVSSPNTPGLRDLQGEGALGSLARELVRCRDGLAAELNRKVPLLVKVSPDLEDHQLEAAVDTLAGEGVDGVIATNTTLSREGVESRKAEEAGGLSGALLADRSTRVVAKIAERTAGALPIIAVGGILGGADARAKLEAGASLVQIYTGLVYRGPRLVGEVARAAARIRRGD